MEFHVIADEETVTGFRFAGVRGTVVSDAREAAAELDRLARAKADEVVIVTERVADGVRRQINAIRFGDTLPLIVEIPGPEGPAAEGPSLLKLIREAVGIRL
ncbi:MAG: Vacuolar H+transporting two-sector ATPase F subunit [Candidatus Brocadiaceae bacterium]|nr:Vacuolar H+transporting two-sector ATPase F subunit [Candidatus Brocadiaceae bacterium]